MKAASILASASASVRRPVLGATMNSTGAPSFCASALPRSAVMPRGLPSVSLITNSADIFGAKATPKRSLPVGINSFTAFSCAAAVEAASAVTSSIPHNPRRFTSASLDFHQIRRQRRETVRAAKLHGADQLGVHVLHHLPHTVGAANAQPPERRPAEQDRAGAERQRLDDVGAAPDAT